MIDSKLWEKCVAFHGHECPGLATGYRAALYAIKLLDIAAPFENLSCISENNNCSVDGIRVILGCTEKKGNLSFNMTGNMAYTFIDGMSGRSIRLSLRERPEGQTREEHFKYLHSQSDEALFEVSESAAI